MLPFLKKHDEKASGSDSSAIKRKPDHEVDYDAMESAAQDLADALKSNDIRGVAIALRAAFELCDSEPHEEGPNLEHGEV